MNFTLAKDYTMWNGFLLQNDASFLQSWEWGSFQEKLERKIWRMVVESPSADLGQAGEVLLQALVIKKSLPFGKSYLYIPFGPCFKQNLPDEQKKQALETLLIELRKISRQERVTYCYLEPRETRPPESFWAQFLGGRVSNSSSQFQKPQKRIQPKRTLIIDLTLPEEQIFNSLKSKTTRYNIRFAEKRGVKFVAPQRVGDKEINIFFELAEKSAKRDGFANYSKDYFEKLFAASSNDAKIRLCLAQYQNEIIAANILVFFGKTAVHLFGGFNHEFKQLMAPYFMHWQQMLQAKNVYNCSTYDFWGIDEKKWPGVTHFKRSFGGKEIEYSQGYDIVFNNFWYRIFKLARKVLRK